MGPGCQAAKTMMMNSYKGWVWGESDQMVAEIIGFKRDHVKPKTGASDVPILGYFNNTAPCMVNTDINTKIQGLLGWMLSENQSSACIALSPVFTWTKGKLHLEEKRMLTDLESGNHNLDHAFYLKFKECGDARDERRMIYPGRFILPGPVILQKCMWGSSDLVRDNITPDVKQLPSSQMVQVEDC